MAFDAIPPRPRFLCLEMMGSDTQSSVSREGGSQTEFMVPRRPCVKRYVSGKVGRRELSALGVEVDEVLDEEDDRERRRSSSRVRKRPRRYGKYE